MEIESIPVIAGPRKPKGNYSFEMNRVVQCSCRSDDNDYLTKCNLMNRELSKEFEMIPPITINTIAVGISAGMYFIVAISYFLQGKYPWSFIWLCYCLANIGLLWAASK